MTTLRTAAIALLVLLCLAAARPPLAAAQATFVPLTKPMRLTAPVYAPKGGAAVYIVKLREPGAASYKGGAVGFAATKPGAGQRMNAHAAAVQTYVGRLQQTHDRLLAEVGAGGAKVYSYSYVLNGFAAELTAAQVSQLARRPEVERIWLDRDQTVDTNNSAIFLGLEDQDGGLRADLKLRGEDIVVGVIDSGVAPNHPSLADKVELIPRMCRGRWAETSWLGLWLCAPYRNDPPTELMYDPPIGFTGTCQAGPGFEPTDCNNKVVGARFYLDGFVTRNELDPREFRSPRDADGHGTHVATTIVGNAVDASLFGTRVARVAGIAPRARVAVYKGCWVKPGETRATCATSDLARAVDDAVADGVDIINYSLGSMETDLSAPDDLALLNAFDAGVLTVVAAGNDGPELDTIGSPSSAPWVLTVGASTQSGTLFDEAIRVTAPEDIAGVIPMREASFTPKLTSEDPIEEALVEVDDGQVTRSNGSAGSVRDACEPVQNGDDLDGRIALIERGGCEFTVKLMHAEEAGAIGVVVYNNTSDDPTVMNGDVGSVDIPAVMIGAADGDFLLDVLAGGDEVRVELAKGTFISLSESGNQMADFSSRGPPLSDLNFLKPDVTAPGVAILAGTTPAPANGLQGETFQYFSGTSQAAPEVTGVAILLKEAHPDWSPGELKSALMTSAHQSVVNSDGEAATPFDRGSGHIDANKANDPGLVYTSEYRDYAAYLCGFLEPPFPPADCAALAAAGFSNVASDVNVASIALANLITGDTVKRRVKNVGPPATYRAVVTAPEDVDVTVEPASLVLNTGQTAEFSVRFADSDAAPLDLWTFGQLAWTDDTHTVTSPLAVQPVALRVPLELQLRGRSGSTTLPIAFGYGGEYLARSHGLRAPFLDGTTGLVPTGFVDDDPTNTFQYPGGNGLALQGIDVPADQLYLRVALFDEFTDGADDLDLYLFFCGDTGTTDNCAQIASSDGFTSDEQINITAPERGLYVVVVHGFETDQVAGGPGANYSLFTWSFGVTDDVGNLDVAAPTTVVKGDRLDLDVTWSALDPATRYLGAISHDTPFGVYEITIVDVTAP
jgi:subtilisin family serine protease